MARTGQGTSHTARTISACVALAIAATLCLLSACSEKQELAPYIYGGLGTDSLFKSDASSLVLETSLSPGTRAASPQKSRRLVVCNWRGRSARCHLWFSQLPETTATVIRADLFLYATRIQGNSLADEYEIYALADTLDEDSLTWADLDAGLSSGKKVAAFALAGGTPGSMASDSVVLDLTDLVSSWVGRETDNCGIAIKLADEIASEAIAEFASREDASTRTIADDTTFYVRPALRISYVKPEETDTSYALALCTNDTFVDSLLVPLPDTLLACSNGFPSRTYLKFDLSEIPGQASVIRSAITLVPDLEASSFDVMTIACHALLDSFSNFDTPYGVKGAGTTTLTCDSLSVASPICMDVTTLVQNIVAGLVTNYGFLIKTTDETVDLDFLIFSSTRTGNPNLAPHLAVLYTIPAPPRYRRD